MESYGAYTIVLALIAATALALRRMGRVWGEAALWTPETASAHTSQRVADPYTFSHLLHGILFYGILSMTAWAFETKLVAATAIECIWELSENTEKVINRYRQTAALGYSGDSILNSTSDILAMLAGFGIAHMLPWYASAAIVIAVELGMLLKYKDNLSLNIIMLIHPIQRIKKWQTQA